MIRLDTGTPGAGKTLINVKELIEREKENKKNLQLNKLIHKNNYEVITRSNLVSELSWSSVQTGTGRDIQTIYTNHDQGYFDFYNTGEDLEDYFARTIFYNRIIDRINKEHKLTLNPAKPVRTMYSNINGLTLETVYSIPSDFDWRKCPDGSIFVIDEIQEVPIFSAENKQIDPILKAMSKHRHRGFDIIGITQFPSMVHPYFRNLVGHHRHLVNYWGAAESTIYNWSTAKVDPNAFRNKFSTESKDKIKFDPSIFKYYVSTTADTRKTRYPWRVILTVGAIVLAGLIILGLTLSKENNFFVRLFGGGSQVEQKEQEKVKEDVATPQQDIPQPEQTPQPKNITYDPSQPFNVSPAQINEQLPYVPVNQRYLAGCIKYGSSCNCYDQQAVKLDVSVRDCKKIIDDGMPFDYFRPQNNQAINTTALPPQEKPIDTKALNETINKTS
jgi:hypothetical protein